jgi:predicted enzyme related to lactoylglutathione lyase
MPATVTQGVDWFEIPVRDLDRAQAFYETIFAARLRRETIGGNSPAVFGAEPDAVKGCLISGPSAVAPSEAGTLVYLNAGPSLDAVLARLSQTGGRVLSSAWASTRSRSRETKGEFTQAMDQLLEDHDARQDLEGRAGAQDLRCNPADHDEGRASTEGRRHAKQGNARARVEQVGRAARRSVVDASGASGAWPCSELRSPRRTAQTRRPGQAQSRLRPGPFRAHRCTLAGSTRG